MPPIRRTPTIGKAKFHRFVMLREATLLRRLNHVRCDTEEEWHERVGRYLSSTEGIDDAVTAARASCLPVDGVAIGYSGPLDYTVTVRHRRLTNIAFTATTMWDHLMATR